MVRACGRGVRLLALAFGGLLAGSRPPGAAGQEEGPPPRPLAASTPAVPPLPSVASFPTAAAKPYPINLPTALRLANARNLDIVLASQRLEAANAQLKGARVLWLPNIILGGDYARHDGPFWFDTGQVIGNSKQAMMVGAAPQMIFSFADAIFSPLAARQTALARQADVQTAANDTLLAVAQAYFNLLQARGQLAGAVEALRFTDDLASRLDRLAPGLVPPLEVQRGRVLAATLRQARLQSENNWRSASAELLRVLDLDPTLVVEPLEPSHIRMSLFPLDKPVDDLVPVALTNRPELASQQAIVQATLQVLRQEKVRPLVPSLLFRGYSTPVTGTLGAGYFGGGFDSNVGNFSFREDWDCQLLWTLQNIGFGNKALVKQRLADNKAALAQLFLLQDRVAAEVVQAYSLAQTADGRTREAESELHDAQALVRENLAALGQTQRLGEGGPIRLVVRPLEVVAAIQMLQQAYVDFYGSIADANRAQFQLYRALGNPAQDLVAPNAGQPIGAPCGDPAPSAPPPILPASPPPSSLPACAPCAPSSLSTPAPDRWRSGPQ